MTTEAATGQDQGPHRAPRSIKRNYRLGVLNGALARMGMGFVSPHLILAAFVYDRTGSNLLVGLLATLSVAGVMWPQLYISSVIEHRPRKKPFYVLFTILRAASLAVVAASIWLSGSHSGPWAITTFFVAYFSTGVARDAATCRSSISSGARSRPPGWGASWRTALFAATSWPLWRAS